MAQWAYSDWITQTDDSTRLTRLRLHIQEVSEYVLRTRGEGLESELNDEYMPRLFSEETKLAELIRGNESFRYGGRNRARFSNVE